MEALRLFLSFSASLRWNYPNRFVGSPYFEVGTLSPPSSPSFLFKILIIKNSKYVNFYKALCEKILDFLNALP